MGDAGVGWIAAVIIGGIAGGVTFDGGRSSGSL
jgi:hypothetical protein